MTPRTLSIARRLFRPAMALLAGALALSACDGDGDDDPAPPGALVAVEAFAPAAGAKGVVAADAPLPRPTTTPCVVTLFSGVEFSNFDDHPFAYPGSAGCAGPFAKVVLEADYSVTAGRQFDRTALISIGGVDLYFGTTQEPSADVAPSWHVERDVTEVAQALAGKATGYALLGNVVDATYTGVLHGSARLLFYPAATDADAATPRIADAVIPFAGDPVTGAPANLASAAQTLQRTLTLPTNLVRAYLDVIAQSQGGDEFWMTCVPDALAGTLQSCGGGSFREVLVRIDGQAAGLAPVAPRIYTGGIDPGLWRPTPGVETLAFIPYRVDLTPFAGALSDGKPHTVSIAVEGAQDHFAVVGTLLLYRDAGAATTGGAVTENTLAGALSDPVVKSDIVTGADGAASGPVSTTAGRSFVVAGYVDTSKGRITTRLEQSLAFSNRQTFAIDAAAYVQTVDQLGTVDSKTSIVQSEFGGTAETIDTVALRYPLTLAYTFDNAANTQSTVVSQSLGNTVSRKVNGDSRFDSSFLNAVQSSSKLIFDPAGGPTQRAGQQGSQDVTYGDSLGSCYERHVDTALNALTTFTDGTGCEGGNMLNWLAQPDGAPAQGLLAQWGTD